MNPDTSPSEAAIAEILGLETSPDGKPYYLLIYDANGTVIEGVDFSDEVKQLSALLLAARRDELKLIESLRWKAYSEANDNTLAGGIVQNFGYKVSEHLAERLAQLTAAPESDDISLCENGCYCMTHTIDGHCGKCQAIKMESEESK